MTYAEPCITCHGTGRVYLVGHSEAVACRTCGMGVQAERIAAARCHIDEMQSDFAEPLAVDDIRRAGVPLRLPGHLKMPITRNPLGVYKKAIA